MVEIVHITLVGRDVGVIELYDESVFGELHFLDDSEPVKVEDVGFLVVGVFYRLFVERCKLDHMLLTPNRLKDFSLGRSGTNLNSLLYR